jgi:hypothetical protein
MPEGEAWEYELELDGYRTSAGAEWWKPRPAFYEHYGHSPLVREVSDAMSAAMGDRLKERVVPSF